MAPAAERRPDPAPPGVSAEGADELAAGGLAAPAGLGADAAVLVDVGVAGALVAAGPARRGAGLQDRAGQVRVVAGVPREHPASGVADVGAVEVGADARPQLGDHLLAQAGVGAGRAGLRALEARLDAGDELLLVDTPEVGRVGVEHLAGNGHGCSLRRPTTAWGRLVGGRGPRRTTGYPDGRTDNESLGDTPWTTTERRHTSTRSTPSGWPAPARGCPAGTTWPRWRARS